MAGHVPFLQRAESQRKLKATKAATPMSLPTSTSSSAARPSNDIPKPAPISSSAAHDNNPTPSYVNPSSASTSSAGPSNTGTLNHNPAVLVPAAAMVDTYNPADDDRHKLLPGYSMHVTITASNVTRNEFKITSIPSANGRSDRSPVILTEVTTV
jgi:hypothetical protein